MYAIKDAISFLQSCRWFQGKHQSLVDIICMDICDLNSDLQLGIYKITLADNSIHHYAIFQHTASGKWSSMDAPHVLNALFGRLFNHDHNCIAMHQGQLIIHRSCDDIHRMGNCYHAMPDTSTNSLIACEHTGQKKWVAKMQRRLIAGASVELEVNQHLQYVGFSQVPHVIGHVSYRSDDGQEYPLMILYDYIEHDGSAWDMIIDCIQKNNRTQCKQHMHVMGEFIAKLHVALSQSGDMGFGKVSTYDVLIGQWQQQWNAQLQRSIACIEKKHAHLKLQKWISDQKNNIIQVFEQAGQSLAYMPYCIRQHGDLHLGQVLGLSGKYTVIDFEGEPLKPYDERVMHYPIYKDIAGMMRSMDYAWYCAHVTKIKDYDAKDQAQWIMTVHSAFLQAYMTTLTAHASDMIGDMSESNRVSILRAYCLDKALYELEYEITNRPDWVEIPWQGIRQLLEGEL